MRSYRIRSSSFILIGGILGGCITINLPEEGVLGGGSFVVNGVAEIVENNGSCAIWLADDGRLFVLFQDPRLPNDDFDAVTTPGRRSRLVLDLRSALGDRCREDAIAAVVDRVLETNGPGASRMMNEVELGLQNTVEQP
ncbi:MAG: hypothetical protein IH987_07405 [Planctomycetes bacterium]|nr:hypothetical protein [Planctomycetota bacterium]